MAEGTVVYDILAKIGIDDKASDPLGRLHGLFGRISDTINSINTNLTTMGGSLDSVGQVSLRVGGEMAGLLLSISGVGEELSAGLHHLQVEGALSEEQIIKVRKAVAETAAAVPGTLQHNLVELVTQLRGVMGGDLEKALQLLPTVALFNRMSGTESGVALVQSMGPRLQAGQGGLEQIQKYMDTVMRIVQSTGHVVSPEQVMQVYRFGGLGATQFSDEFAQKYLPRLIMDLAKGGQGGTGGMAGMMGNVGRLLNTAMQEALKAQEGSKTREPSALLEGVKVDIANPQALAAGLAENLKKAGITDPQAVAKALSEIFKGSGGARAGMPIYEMVMDALRGPETPSRFEQMGKATAAAPGLTKETMHELMSGSLVEQAKQLSAAFVNLGEAMGAPLAKMRSEAMSHLVDFINSMSTMMASVEPETMDKVAKALIALAGGIIALGAVAVVAAALAVAGPVTAAIAVISGIVLTLAAMNWKAVEEGFTFLKNAITGFIDWIKSIGTALGKLLPGGAATAPATPGGALTPPPGSGAGPRTPNFNLPVAPGGASFQGAPAAGAPRIENASWQPGGSTVRPVMVAMTLNIDGQTLAQAVSTQVANLYEHPTSAPLFDGHRVQASADDQVNVA